MDPALEHYHLSRRRFLTSSASGLGAAALGSLLSSDGLLANAAQAPHFAPRAKRAIFLYLAGGTSQVELFDPKPKLIQHTGEPIPESFLKNEKRLSFIELDKSKLMGSRLGFRRYGQCGMEMSEFLPNIGKHADDIALIRSMYTSEFDHGPGEMFFSTGEETPGRPSAGAWISYGLGTENQDLPSYVVLITGRSPVARMVNWGSGFLPTQNAGVLFRSTGEPLLNLANPPGVSREVQRLELDAMRELNRRRVDAIGDRRINDRIQAYELAFRMQMAGPELIDLSTEDPKTLEAYGVHRTGNEQGSFSTNCLLARRMVERGVRFVSVVQRRWDHHGNVTSGIKTNTAIVDQPIGALLHDLKERGLLEDTLVVWGTEFGRTPISQNSDPGPTAGRDHHRFAFSVWMAGGGVKGGQVVGSTDEFGWHAVENRASVHDFHATMLHLFGLDHLKLTYRFKGLDFRLTDQHGEVIHKVLA